MNMNLNIKKSILLFSITSIIIGGSGFFPLSAQESGTALQQTTRLRADLQVVREDQRKLHLMLQEQQRIINSLRNQVAEMSRQIERLNTAAADESPARQDIEALRRAIRQESQAREKAIETVIDSLSEEIAALSARQATQRTPARPAPEEEWTGPVQGEYTVSSGDTLSAIAQAFGVSISRLKEANNLRGDLIREGQVLVIPE